MIKARLTLLLLIGTFLISCERSTERAFFYWKSVYKTNPENDKLLADLEISKLYIRFFDVDWLEQEGIVAPKAKIRFTEKAAGNQEIIPVVYIVNRALQKTKPEAVEELSAKILRLTNEIASNNHIGYSELQIDCDWTDNTKDKYFVLLSHLNTSLQKRKILLSTTIRLHQIKYKEITGIPPAQRGMLMYYNMGKISAEPGENSIFSPHEAAKYNNYIKDYPLPLDVALPVFSWGIHSRGGQVIELLNNMNSDDFENRSNFSKKEKFLYVANNSFFYRGFYFMKGDEVKIEEITPKDCQTAAKQLKDKIETVGTVALFHLDSLSISRYEKQDFEKIFNLYP